MKKLLLLGLTFLTFTGFTQHSVNFDPSDDYIALGNNFNFDYNQPFTIEAWIKTDVDPTSGAYPIFSKTMDTPTSGYNFYVHDGKLRLQLMNNYGSNFYEAFTTSNVITQANQWYHVAVVYTGVPNSLPDLQFFVDGVEVTEKTPNGGSLNATMLVPNEAKIGVSGTAAGHFDGNIDEVRIWDTVRTANELLTLKDSCLQGDEPRLLGYFKLDDGSGAVASNEVQGGENGTLMNMDSVQAWMDGVAISCETPPPAPLGAIQFDPSDDFVSLGNHFNFDINDPFTIEAWIKLDVAPTAGAFPIMSKTTDTPTSGYNFYVHDGKLRIQLMNAYGSNFYEAFTTNNVITEADQWYHVAFVYGGVPNSLDDLQFFVDGIEIMDKTPNGGSLSASMIVSQDAKIGIAGTAAGSFDGAMDELRIWNVKRHPQQIMGNMNNCDFQNDPTLVGYFKFDEPVGASTISNSGNTQSTGMLINMDSSLAWVNGIVDCNSSVIPGCTDPTSLTFNPLATMDDGSCTYDTTTVIFGCTNPDAQNFNLDADMDDGSCIVVDSAGITTIGNTLGCLDPNAENFDDLADIDNGSCHYSEAYLLTNPEIDGCLDTNALTYNELASIHNPSHCIYEQDTVFSEISYSGEIVDTLMEETTSCEIDFNIMIDSAIISQVYDLETSSDVVWQVYQRGEFVEIIVNYPSLSDSNNLVYLTVSCSVQSKLAGKPNEGTSTLRAVVTPETTVITDVTSQATNDIFTYPNPVANVISLQGIEDIAEITVFNNLGLQVDAPYTGGNSIKVSELTPGVYSIVVATSKGKSYQLKFLKN